MQRGGCPVAVPNVPSARAFSEPDAFESQCFRTEVAYVGVLTGTVGAEGEVAVLVSDPNTTTVHRVMTVWKADAVKLYELSEGRMLSVRGVMRWISYRRPPYLLATSVDVVPEVRSPTRAGSVVVTPLPASSSDDGPSSQPAQQ
jgi:hypothetical protein